MSFSSYLNMPVTFTKIISNLPLDWSFPLYSFFSFSQNWLIGFISFFTLYSLPIILFYSNYFFFTLNTLHIINLYLEVTIQRYVMQGRCTPDLFKLKGREGVWHRGQEIWIRSRVIDSIYIPSITCQCKTSKQHFNITLPIWKRQTYQSCSLPLLSPAMHSRWKNLLNFRTRVSFNLRAMNHT